MQTADETIRRKAVFIESLKQTGGNVKESLRRAKLDRIAALNLAANDAAFRQAWETASNRKLFS